MIKNILYGLLGLTTVIRLVDVIYLLSYGNTNLPAPVLLITSGLIIYGIALMVLRFVAALRLKQLMAFFLIHAVVMCMNIAFVSFTYPLEITPLEMVAVGSFLDVLVDVCVVYFCARQLRKKYAFLTSGTGGQGR